jgi:hypothetical protein
MGVKRSYEKEMIDFTGNSAELLAGTLSDLRMLNRYLRGSRGVVLALQRAIRARAASACLGSRCGHG